MGQEGKGREVEDNVTANGNMANSDAMTADGSMKDERNIVCEGDEIIVEWYKRAAEIKTTGELTDFIDGVCGVGDMDYGAAVHAAAAVTVAASWLMSHKIGFSGFQASLIGLEYLMHWTYPDSIGIRVTDFSKMLYPQHGDHFDKTIKQSTWEALQNEAKRLLEEKGYAHPKVIAHWQSIVDGNVPFGFTVEDEE